MLIKRYRYARDHANYFQHNHASSPAFKKEALSLLRAVEIEAYNAMEFARRILYGTPL